MSGRPKMSASCSGTRRASLALGSGPTYKVSSSQIRSAFRGVPSGFRRLAGELGVTPALLAHRYALSLDIDTLVLGVKNRQELAECVAAAEAGPLPPELLARIDQTVDPETC